MKKQKNKKYINPNINILDIGGNVLDNLSTGTYSIKAPNIKSTSSINSPNSSGGNLSKLPLGSIFGTVAQGLGAANKDASAVDDAIYGDTQGHVIGNFAGNISGKGIKNVTDQIKPDTVGSFGSTDDIMKGYNSLNFDYNFKERTKNPVGRTLGALALGMPFLDFSTNKTKFDLNNTKAAAEGAQIGSIGGPWGALAGVMAGGTLEKIGDMTVNKRIDAYNEALRRANEQQNASFNNSLSNFKRDSFLRMQANNGINPVKYGGMLNTYKNGGVINPYFDTFGSNAINYLMANEQLDLQAQKQMINKYNTGGSIENPHGIVEYNAGGTHFQNPRGGVPISLDPQGVPNAVEEGELNLGKEIIPEGDFILSHSLIAPKEIARSLGVKSNKKMTFADLGKEIKKEAEERPNDAISKRALKTKMRKLAQAQETLKQQQEQEALALGLESPNVNTFQYGSFPNSNDFPYWDLYKRAKRTYSSSLGDLTAAPTQIKEDSIKAAKEAEFEKSLSESSVLPEIVVTPNPYNGEYKPALFPEYQKAFNTSTLLDNVSDSIFNLKNRTKSIIAPKKDTSIYNTENEEALKDIVRRVENYNSNDALIQPKTSTERAKDFLHFYHNNPSLTVSPDAYLYALDGLVDFENTYLYPFFTEGVTKNKQAESYNKMVERTKLGDNYYVPANSFSPKKASVKHVVTKEIPNKKQQTSTKVPTEQQTFNTILSEQGVPYDYYMANVHKLLNSLENTEKTPIPTVQGSTTPNKNTKKIGNQNYRSGINARTSNTSIDDIHLDNLNALLNATGSKPTDPLEFNPELAKRIRQQAPDTSNTSNTSNTSTSEKEDDGLYQTWSRYVPAFGSALGLALAARPADYSNADRIRKAINGNKITPRFIGDYIQENPLDREYLMSQMIAQGNATRRAIRENAAGNRANANASLLANDYATQIAMGEAFRQGDLYNRNDALQVAEFNRGTNSTNAEMDKAAQIYNASNGLKLAVAEAEMREKIDNARAAAIAGNLTNLFQSIGNIGKENFIFNQINKDRSNLYKADRRGDSHYVTPKNALEELILTREGKEAYWDYLSQFSDEELKNIKKLKGIKTNK